VTGLTSLGPCSSPFRSLRLWLPRFEVVTFYRTIGVARLMGGFFFPVPLLEFRPFPCIGNVHQCCIVVCPLVILFLTPSPSSVLFCQLMMSGTNPLLSPLLTYSILQGRTPSFDPLSHSPLPRIKGAFFFSPARAARVRS